MTTGQLSGSAAGSASQSAYPPFSDPAPWQHPARLGVQRIREPAVRVSPAAVCAWARGWLVTEAAR